jgi:predicted Co/Zn/Cd cation transporter (cation efflux family)
MNFINSIVSFLSGRKTYVIAIIAIIYGISIGDTKIVFDALMAICIRLGIAKV